MHWIAIAEIAARLLLALMSQNKPGQQQGIMSQANTEAVACLREMRQACDEVLSNIEGA